jgi:dTDP-glucose 4,6-dehydratase
LWHELAGSRIFITGGTGFFGIWLLESIAAANDTLKVGVGATVLSRDPQRFAARNRRLAARPEFEWLAGSAESFPFPTAQYDYVIHLATASAAEVGAGDTALTLATLLGTQRILQFAQACSARRLLLASSGAVYGRQPGELSHVPETYVGAPNPQRPSSAYGEIKRLSELMCALTPQVESIIARGFSFFGPGLPLTDKFAIGSLRCRPRHLVADTPAESKTQPALQRWL